MTKNDLKKYRALTKERDQIRIMLEEIETAMYYPKGQRLTGMPRSGGGESVQDRLTPRHVELRQMYHAKLEEIDAERLRIERAIASLDPLERLILRYKYIDGCTWEVICVKLNYGWTQIHEHHNRALRHLKDV